MCGSLQFNLCGRFIFYRHSQADLSAMLKGDPYFHVHPYETLEEILPLLDEILGNRHA
jgi:2'-deoxynucleoside 5'-phosphate N-hydrolase